MECMLSVFCVFFFFQAEDGIRDLTVTGVQTCALPIYAVSFTNGGGDAHRAAADEQRGAGGLPGAGGGAGRYAVAPHELRSEERRVGEEGRTRGAPDHLKKKKKNKEERSIT